MTTFEKPFKKSKKKNAVLIVVYSNAPSSSELASFEQCIKILEKHPICIVCPRSLDVSVYLEVAEKYAKSIQIVPFADAYFTSVKSYNRLVLSIDFYEKFLEYEYILLYQLDAWVFKDELKYWCEKGFDYIGAPWFEGHDGAGEHSPLLPIAGNGGFSLRRVTSILGLLSKKVPYEYVVKSSQREGSIPRKRVLNVTIMSLFMKIGANEDVLFAEYGPQLIPEFKVATPQEAIAFSFEVKPRALYTMNNNTLPFGCHAFEKYDWEFWQDKINLPIVSNEVFMMNDFDYKGLSAEKLEAMCQPSYGVLCKANDSYWTTKAYSMGQFIREYAYLPNDFPLCCYSVHGVNHTSMITMHEIDNTAPFYLCNTKNQYDAYRKACTKPCYIVPTALPWLRAKHGMCKKSDAKGTLAFFQHTTPHVDFLDETNDIIYEYIEELLALPDHMHPICVCLHMHDIHKGYHKFFIEKGVPVYTAGNVFNPHFYKEFYDILLNFSFTTSQHVGSYLFYSAEAGIPFYFHGKKRLYYNFSDENIKKGLYGNSEDIVTERIQSMFSVLTSELTEEQNIFINHFIGKKEKYISRIKLKSLLLKNIQI